MPILRGVDGRASPGQFIIIMGPSGAGMTVGHNQRPRLERRVQSIASYVMQDDVFYATLTVKEHLMFQAELRMGKAFNPEEREARVDYVIDELGLTKCRDSQIGGVTDVRGLSGGERKRLSFATEILTNPSLLFVDEPTSGLDSFMAESVVLQLQKLAREGRTVVATIHQPSSELFTLFDQLYLLSGGHTIYNGKACDAVAYFASQGLQYPTYMNPTNYFLRQIIVLDPYSDAATRMDVLVQAWQRHWNAMNPTIEHHNMDTDVAVFESGRLGTRGQLLLLCKRNVIRLVHNKLSFKARVAQNLFISTVVGLIYLQLKKYQDGIQSFTRALFFMTVNQFIANGMPEFTNVPMELPIMIREYQGGLYQAWVYVYFMIGFGGDAGVFFIFYVNLSLLCSAAVDMGYMVGCITRCPDVGQILGVLVALPLVIFGGLFINSNTTPVCFVWLEYLSPLKYGFRGLSRAFWNSVEVIPCSLGQHCQALNGPQVLANLGLNKNLMVVNVVALLCVDVLFRLIGITWLWASIRRKHF
ncbi:hypothetical protein H257_13012 [Aphanomyces astaci]|uniref:ABC transporter domain-containing protein n=1 Tax=Aphanomyces astaci TaxID=112090 RepID=W4FWK6_APHAT|nr:hypothetical protein H257_13012 [Aphanomyces astaci]ETV71877.1 hypothetical protein H257_13012 [Aphanomyces astaci]|eukprot:XP_009838726.1 hypothetical protein H257_13012 [Aphanomyces astaci]